MVSKGTWMDGLNSLPAKMIIFAKIEDPKENN